MKRLATLVGMAMLIAAACGGAASPAATQPSVAPPTAAEGATPGAMAPPTAALVTATVTFDGTSCSYAGPAVVEAGTTIVWKFENTPAAIAASTEKGAKSIGSELVVLAVAEGTTWEQIVAGTPPEGEKGAWGTPPPILLTDSAQVGYGPSAVLSTVADGYGYLVMCNLYWDYDTGTPLAIHKGALVRVLGG